MRVDATDDFVMDVHKLRQMSLVILHGEVDLARIHLLADAVDHLVCRKVPLLFDLTNVRYIDSTGLHFMRQVHEQCEREHVQFAMVTSALVRRLCGLLSLEAVIPIFPTTTLARDHIAAEWGCPTSDARVPS